VTVADIWFLITNLKSFKQLEPDLNKEDRFAMRRVNLGVGLVVIVLAMTARAVPPDQPYMEAALGNLNTAKNELQAASRDKGGHRAKAAALVNQAIGEVNKGVQFARRHNHAAAIDQPHMQAALDALNSAKDNLENAVDDKGGHRKKAIELVKAAIDEVQLGIQAGEGG